MASWGVSKDGRRLFGSKVRRGCAALLVLAASTVVMTQSAAAASDPPAPVAQIALNKPVYDRFEPIIVDLGAVGFFPSCDGITGANRDFIYPWADIYIVRGTPGTTLTDVNGEPNAVAGFGGGGFFDEVIGYAGVNNLTPGTYSVVVDECQDGKLQSNDSVFPNLFRVTSRTSVEPLLGIGTLKQNAGNLSEYYDKGAKQWKALMDAERDLGCWRRS